MLRMKGPQMIRKNALCHIKVGFFKNNYIFCIAIVLFVVTFTAYSKDLEKGNESNTAKLTWENGVAFQSGKALFIDFRKIDDAELNMTEGELKKSKTNSLKAAVIEYTDPDLIHVYDAYKNDRYGRIDETERTYKYKINKNKAYLVNDKGEKALVNITFVNYLSEPKKRDEETFPCMVIHWSCKWFEGDYEIRCP